MGCGGDIYTVHLQGLEGLPGIEDFNKVGQCAERELAESKRFEGQGGHCVANIFEDHGRPGRLGLRAAWNGEVELELRQGGQILEKGREHDLGADPSIIRWLIDACLVDGELIDVSCEVRRG